MNELIRLANCHLDSAEILASQIFTHKKHKDKDESPEDLQAFGKVRPLEEGQKKMLQWTGSLGEKALDEKGATRNFLPFSGSAWCPQSLLGDGRCTNSSGTRRDLAFCFLTQYHEQR